MIRFEGDRSIPLPITGLAAKLSDAGFLVGCLPDVQVSEAGPDRAVWKLKPRLTFLTGSLSCEMSAVSREPAEGVAFKVFTKAMGASATVMTTLAFREIPGGTAVHWTGEIIEVTGLLKAVPKGLLQGTASKVIDDVWTAIEHKLRQTA
jgi:carbon monoxide dehydrogenase subunit G